MNGHTLHITGIAATQSNATYYFGDEMEYRVTQDNITTIENIIAGENLARRVHGDTYDQNAEYEYFIKNHLGSTMLAVLDDGTLATKVTDYFPYGKQKEIEARPSGRITQSFTGKELDLYEGDAVTGEDGEGRYYFGKRYYDAEIGIFTSTDLTEEFWNKYAYSSNPILLIDPDGNDFISAQYYYYYNQQLESRHAIGITKSRRF